jgi:lipoyl(octanoyl) transferase
MNQVGLLNLGRVPYAEGLALQHELVDRLKRGEGRDTLVLLEHPPVLTLGRNAAKENILATPELLNRVGVEVHYVERGGDVTYHGPGQLVGYPIFDLRHYRMDVGWFVRELEQVLIQALAHFGVHARRAGLGQGGKRDPKLVGVWVDNPAMDPYALMRHPEAKIAQIGVRIERWVSYHGFALNIDPDLRHFEFIVPCGLPDKPVTSLVQVLGRQVSIPEVRAQIADAFSQCFGIEFEAATEAESVSRAPAWTG